MAIVFIYLSLIANIAILVPVCTGLIQNAPWAEAAYGVPTPARAILLSVYGTILLASVLLLMRPAVPIVVALLLAQVIYKISTPLTTGMWSNPVVVANLWIAGLHVITLLMIWRVQP